MDTEYNLQFTQDSEEFNRVIDYIIRKQSELEKVFKGTSKAVDSQAISYKKVADSVADYQKQLNKLYSDISSKSSKVNKELERNVELLNRATGLSGSVSNQRSNTENRSFNNNVNQLNNLGKGIESSRNQVISSSLGKITNSNQYTRLLSNAIKDTKPLIQGIKEYNLAVKGGGALATESASALTVASGAAVAGIGLLAAALTAMTVAGRSAYENTLKINQGLRAVGGGLSGVGSDSIETANKLNYMKNAWGTMFNDFKENFLGLFEGLVDVGYDVTKDIKGESEALTATNAQAQKLLNFANELNNKLGIDESKSVPILQELMGNAKQTGLSNNSAVNMATGTYSMASKLAQEYGVDVNTVASQLGKAWANGDNSAKDYGIILDDDTLKGWLMLEKGVDAVNVTLSDAAMEAYRYELAMVQASQSGSESLQGQIAEWKQYGSLIEKTKNQLFSFEEVITLSAYDNTIPEVAGLNSDLSGVVDKEKEKEKVPVDIVPTKPDIPIKIKPDGLEEVQDELKTITQPVVVPTSIVVNPDGIADLVTALDLVKEGVDVPVAVRVPDIAPVYNLAEALDLIPGMVMCAVTASVLGLGAIKNLLKNIEAVPSSVLCEVSLVTSGVALLDRLLAKLNSLMETYPVTIPATVTGLSLVYSLATLLENMPKTCPVNVPVSVSGVEVLERIKQGIHSIAEQLSVLKNGLVDFSTQAVQALNSLKSSIQGFNLAGKIVNGVNSFGNFMNESGANDYINKINAFLYNEENQKAVGKFGLTATIAPLGSGAIAESGIIEGAATTIGNAMLQGGSYGSIALGFHASGGVSSKAHIAAVSEGDRQEVIIPSLDSTIGQKALQEIGRGASESSGAGGDTYNVYLNNIYGDDNLKKTIESEVPKAIEKVRRNRGELSYGRR